MVITRPLPLRLAGMGVALPDRVVTNAEIEARLKLPAGWVERRTGVRERRWASVDDTNSSLGARAAQGALAEAGWGQEDVDLIISAAGTPEQAIPDTAPLIQRALGWGASGIPCFSVHATCLSFLAALWNAAALIAAGSARRILIVSAEIGSPALNFAEPEAAALFGDGAAAVAVEAGEADGPALLAARWETYGESAALTELRGCGSRLHPSRSGATPEDQLFHMDGLAAARAGRRQGAGFLERLRPGLSRGLPEIDLVIPHQTSRLGLELLADFAWPTDQIVNTLADRGNCIAASIPLTLQAARAAGRTPAGSRVLLVGTGAGLSLAGLIWRM